MREEGDIGNVFETRRELIELARRSQSLDELRRKANRARRLKGKIWTTEEIDLAKVESAEISRILRWG
jgi:hypothetical protein